MFLHTALLASHTFCAVELSLLQAAYLDAQLALASTVLLTDGITKQLSYCWRHFGCNEASPLDVQVL